MRPHLHPPSTTATRKGAVQVIRANTSFLVGQRWVHAGDIVATDDPIVAGREHLFDSVDVPTRVVEQATATPGEKRSTRRVSKSTGK